VRLLRRQKDKAENSRRFSGEWPYHVSFWQKKTALPASTEQGLPGNHVHVIQKIKFFRKRIPSFECVPGCHDCCGPVMTSSYEASELPEKSEAEHDAALSELSCTYLGSQGCSVYEDRPLICRLFGTTPSLLCPHGKRPASMIDAQIEVEIQDFFSYTRMVLV
jgi:hypothetical protein